MHNRRSVKRILGTGFLLLMFALLFVPKSAFAATDDQFGMSYDSGSGSRTSWVPSGTQGIYMAYSISTTGVSCGNSSGWIAAVDTLRVTGGSPYEALLQASLALGCTGSSSDQWNVQYGYYDNNNNFNSYTISSLSTSTYSSLSGYIEIYYTGSCWTEVTYVSQDSTSYSPSSGCYGSGDLGGTTVDNSNNDWTSVETDAGQVGLSLSSSFKWQLTSQEFYVSSSWQDWNQHSASWYGFHGYAVVTVAPGTSNPNNIGTAFLSSTPGIYAQIGQSATDGSSNFWCISGTCPPMPP
jgi:hypothetical protein